MYTISRVRFLATTAGTRHATARANEMHQLEITRPRYFTTLYVFMQV